MHLLYLDDSGSVQNPGERHLVLGGLSVYEAQAFHFTQKLDELAAEINPSDPHHVEFHASDIFGGRHEPWRNLARDERISTIKRVLRIFAESYDTAKAFVCAIEKAAVPSQDAMELAFEDLCGRFDIYLNQLRLEGDRQRGLIILDNSAHETSLLSLARDFRTIGTRWGVSRHLADTPMFLDSRSSRVVQVADHIAYAVFRRYEAGDASYFDIIANKFHAADGIVHGLSHKTRDRNCMCPACLTRRIAASPAPEPDLTSE